MIDYDRDRYYRRRASCPWCGEWVLVNLDGKLRKHRRWVSGGIYSRSSWVACEPPKDMVESN